MEILLTGNSGFLGNILFNFIKSDNNVIGLSRSSDNYKINLINNEINFKKYFDLVIHAAGIAHEIPKRKEDVQKFFEVNVKGTANLLKALEIPSPPKSFVFISTVAVYGINRGNLVNEDAPLLAVDPYGQSKILAEKLVQEWCKNHNVKCTIFRLPLIAGPNPPGNLRLMIKGIQYRYYFNIERGKARKSIVLAEDVAKYIIKASDIGGIFNLTDGYHPNFNELSRNISLQFGIKFVPNMPFFCAKILAKIGDLIGDKFPINSNKLAKIVGDLTFDDSKAKEAFGWSPTSVLKGFKIQ